MSNNAPDYEDNLAFPPQEESVEQKLAHSEKMRDLQVEYVCNLEEKLRIATEVITQARDTAYDSCQTCPKCEFIDKILTDLLGKIKD